jgi:hypothetical protein
MAAKKCKRGPCPNRAAPNRVRCLECLARAAEHVRRHSKKKAGAGLCRRGGCGRNSLKGMSLCGIHRVEQNAFPFLKGKAYLAEKAAREKRLREEAIAKGLCRDCRRETIAIYRSTVMCEECLDKSAMRSARRRASRQ